MENINYWIWGKAIAQAKNEIAESVTKYGRASFQTYTAYYIFKHHLLKTSENIDAYFEQIFKQSRRYFRDADESIKDYFRYEVEKKLNSYVEYYEKLVRGE